MVEGAYPLEVTEGAIPEWIRGTWYANGPARFRRGGAEYQHWLDGDGLVASLRFDGTAITFNHRFVRSTKFNAEEEADEALFRTFGTGFDGDRLARGIGLESPVNVSVQPFAGTLLAFGEQGIPWELDPETLETRGPYTFGRRLNPISPFAAHPTADPTTGELFNFGVSFDPRRPAVFLYRFAADGELLLRRRIPLPWPCSMHDFGLSARHAIFHVSPYLLDVQAVIRSGATVMDALDWQPDLGTRLVIVGRDDGEPVAEIPVGQRYALHQVNSFEADGRLHVDVVEYDRPIYQDYQPIPELFQDVPPGRPVRFTVDMATWTLEGTREIPYVLSPDFPAVQPHCVGQPYHHFWMLGISKSGQQGRKFFDQLVHFEWSEDGQDNAPPRDIFQAPPGHVLGCEPAFLDHPDDPNRGAILVKSFDTENQRDTFLLFDAFQVHRGPIAQIPLRRPVPPSFHTAWARSH